MKYKITKSDGSPIDPDARYFVLRLDDPKRPDNKAARKALVAYVKESALSDPGAALAAMEILNDTNPSMAALRAAGPSIDLDRA